MGPAEQRSHLKRIYDIAHVSNLHTTLSLELSIMRCHQSMPITRAVDMENELLRYRNLRN